MSRIKVCTHPGCTEPRWRGPSGHNTKLVKCEKHQREDWRERKTPVERQRAQRPQGPQGVRKTQIPAPKTLKLVIHVGGTMVAATAVVESIAVVEALDQPRLVRACLEADGRIFIELKEAG